jgi:ribosomal protein S18 acetylase RimI-like enzyme
MRTDAPKNTPTHLLKNPEQHITTLGRFLRSSSLDELPQLFNILKGDMSVIGPRPALWNQDDLIAERDKYDANDIRPGLSGWAQVNGRDELAIPVKAALDGFYVENMSLALDIKIIFMTLSRGSGGVKEGAYFEGLLHMRTKLDINNIKIREINENDYDNIISACVKNNWNTFNRRRQDFIKSLEKSTVIVAYDGDNFAGFARFMSDGYITTFICELLVAETYRKKGVGRMIVNHISERFPKTRIDLISEADLFYEKIGLCKLGRGYRKPPFL